MKTNSNFVTIKKITLYSVLIAMLFCISLITIPIKIGDGVIFQMTDGLFLSLCVIMLGWGMIVVAVIYPMLIDLLNAGFIFIPISILIHVLMFLVVVIFKKIKLKYLGIIFAAILILIYVLYSYIIYQNAGTADATALKELIVDSIQISFAIFVGVLLTWIFTKNKIDELIIKRYFKSDVKTIEPDNV